MRSLVLVMLVGVLAGTAGAQPYRPVYPPPPPANNVDPDEPFLFLAGHLGLDLPVGAIGAELGMGAAWFRGSVSFGRGFRGTSVAGMVRAVHQEAGIDFALGAGLSRGPGLHDLQIALGEDSNDDGILTQYGTKTHWFDAEVSAEFTVSEHGFVRFTLGLTHAIDIDCVSIHTKVSDAEVACDPAQVNELQADRLLPYAGIAGGFRFPGAPASRPRYRVPAPVISARR